MEDAGRSPRTNTPMGRRAVVRGAVWSAPAVVAVTAAPAMATTLAMVEVTATGSTAARAGGAKTGGAKTGSAETRGGAQNVSLRNNTGEAVTFTITDTVVKTSGGTVRSDAAPRTVVVPARQTLVETIGGLPSGTAVTSYTWTNGSASGSGSVTSQV